MVIVLATLSFFFSLLEVGVPNMDFQLRLYPMDTPKRGEWTRKEPTVCARDVVNHQIRKHRKILLSTKRKMNPSVFFFVTFYTLFSLRSFYFFSFLPQTKTRHVPSTSLKISCTFLSSTRQEKVKKIIHKFMALWEAKQFVPRWMFHQWFFCFFVFLGKMRRDFLLLSLFLSGYHTQQWFYMYWVTTVLLWV